MKLTDKLEFDGKTVECKRYIQALVPFWSEVFLLSMRNIRNSTFDGWSNPIF